ncbi:MAG: hypothetical protein MK207_08985 [Saprospiraceae bacterium]|nr:hypothetical protein [Saprospiraceae bacterium]
MKNNILNEADIKILHNSLNFHKNRMNYYWSLGIILVFLSWLLFVILKSLGLLISAALISIAIWYFPLRHYKKIKAINLDLSNNEKTEISTMIYGKSISKINRLEPYYYIYTTEETFEVKKTIFNSLQKEMQVNIIYTAISKTILDFKILH